MVALQISDRVLESADLRRCTLCGCWLPEDELVVIARGIRWCGPCAAPHSELVPPPTDVIWPTAGALIGMVVTSLIATTLGALDLSTSLLGMLGCLIGGGVGAGMLVMRSGCTCSGGERDC